MRTKLVGLSFLVLGGLYFWSQHQIPPVTIEDPIFDFEKQELKEVVIHQPTQDIHLIEKDGEWTLLEAKNEASTTMVNRSKHQLHNLKARSIVDTEPNDLDTYGLGENTIQVDLKLRDGRALSLKVGDPNPTGVSYYMMPLHGPHQNTVVTVAKASVDFFASELGDFRAEHFVQFDLDGIDRIEIELSPRFSAEIAAVDSKKGFTTAPLKWTAIRSVQEEFIQWTGGFESEPLTLISKDFIRRLLGRMLALKAIDYKGVIELSDEEAGLNTPLARIALRGNNTKFSMIVGDSPTEGQRFVQVGGLTERVLTRSGFLDEFKFDSNQMKNRLALDFLESSSGLKRMTVSQEQQTIIETAKDGWRVNDRSITEKDLQLLLGHSSKLRIVEWVSDSKDFTQEAEEWSGHYILIEHTFGTVRMDFGSVIERNVALSETDPPQVVRYRRLKLNQDFVDEADDAVVLIEESWLVGLEERLSTVQSQTLKTDGAK